MVFRSRRRVEELEVELARTRAVLEELGAVDLVDLASGRTLRRLDLPSPGDGGLVQLGALQRGDGGAWWLQLQAEPLDRDLGDLARAAGVEVA